MGVKRGKGKGKVDSTLMAQHIGEPNRKRAADRQLSIGLGTPQRGAGRSERGALE